MRGWVAVGMGLLLVACGPTAPDETTLSKGKPVATLNPVLRVDLLPMNVASHVGDDDTVIANVVMRTGPNCTSCTIAWAVYGTTWVTFKKSFIPAGRTANQGAIITSIAVGSAKLRGGYNGKIDTSFVTVTATPPPPGEQAAAADSFAQSIGANVHYSYTNTVYGNRALIASLVADLGIKHLRDGGVSSTSPTYMQNVYGPMAALSAAQGVKWNILGNPFETNQTVWSFTDTRGLDSVTKYLGAVNIESWEGLNEWNSKKGSRPSWATEDQTWQQTLWTYHQTHPAVVVGPSFTNYTDACTVGNVSAWMDLGNMHPYPGGTPQSTQTQNNLTNLTCVNGTDPVIATEDGYHTAVNATSGQPAVTEVVGGRYHPRMFLWNFSKGAPRTYTYELIDQGTSLTQAEQMFGLYRNDGSPKPAAVSVKALVAETADPGAAFTPGTLAYTLGGTLTNVSHVLLQKRDGTFLLALWLEVVSTDTPQTRAITVTFPVSRSGRIVPIPGAATAWTGTTVPLTIGDAVTVLEVAP